MASSPPDDGWSLLPDGWTWGDVGHGALDIAGLVPVFGEGADLANAAWHAAEGNYLDAGLSIISMVPIVGDAIGKGGKLLKKGAGKLAGPALDVLKKMDFKKMLEPLAKHPKIGPYVDKIAEALEKWRADIVGEGGLTTPAGKADCPHNRNPEELPRNNNDNNAPEELPRNNNGVGRFPRSQRELDALAEDPAHGGKIDVKSIQERKVGLDLESRGLVPGPITRDPSGAAEFIDATGTKWDVKGFNSNFPAKKGGFKLDRDAGKIDKSIDLGENVMLDTTLMRPEHVEALRAEGLVRKWGERVVFWP